MRITYLHQYFNTLEMPGGTRSYEMARRLVSWGHDVHMITSDRSRDRGDWYMTDENGIQVHWLPVAYSNTMDFQKRLQAFLRFAAKAARRAATIDCDVVFATSTPLTIALPAIWVSRSRGVPMVFEVRDLWPEAPIAVGAIKNPVAIAAARTLEQVAYRSSSRIVALAPRVARGVIAAGYPEGQVEVIPNGSDLDLFRDAAAGIEGFLKEYPFLRGRKLVVYVGAIGLVNGVERLVEIAHRMRDEPDVGFVIVGAGRQTGLVQERARRAGVLGRNFFMLGSVSKQVVPTVLAASTVAVATVLNDDRRLHGDSMNKVFDYLAAGKPIACAFEGWLSRTVCRHGAGFEVPREPESAAAALASKLSDEAWLETAGLRARMLAESRFSRESQAWQLDAVLCSSVRRSA